MLWLGQRWQAEIHRLMGLEEPAAYTVGGIVVVALLAFAAFVGIGRSVRRVARGLTRLAGRILPPKLARPLAVVVSTVLVIFVVNGVLFQGLVEAVNSAFSVKDGGTEEGAVQPTASERSGSPDSLVPWDDLGLQGRNFVGKGPTPEELSAFSGRPAQEPVRVYTGLASADDVRGARRARRPRAGACRRVRPRGSRHRDHDRDGLGRPGGQRLARVRDERRQRHGGHAVLVPAQLDVVPRRPGQGARRRAAHSSTRCTGSGPTCPPTGDRSSGVRREPRHVRRGGRLQRRGRHPEPYRRGAVGRAAELQRAVAGVRRGPGVRLAGVAAGLRRRADRAVRRRGARPGPADPAPGTTRGSSTCRTPRTRSSGGRPGSSWTTRTGSAESAARTCPRACSGSRSSPSGR